MIKLAHALSPAPVISLIARADRADVEDMRSWIRDCEVGESVPEHFAHGRQVLAFALANLEYERPLQFWGALLAFAALPVLIVSKAVLYFLH